MLHKYNKVAGENLISIRFLVERHFVCFAYVHGFFPTVSDFIYKIWTFLKIRSYNLLFVCFSFIDSSLDYHRQLRWHHRHRLLFQLVLVGLSCHFVGARWTSAGSVEPHSSISCAAGCNAAKVGPPDRQWISHTENSRFLGESVHIAAGRGNTSTSDTLCIVHILVLSNTADISSN